MFELKCFNCFNSLVGTPSLFASSLYWSYGNREAMNTKKSDNITILLRLLTQFDFESFLAHYTQLPLIPILFSLWCFFDICMINILKQITKFPAELINRLFDYFITSSISWCNIVWQQQKQCRIHFIFWWKLSDLARRNNFHFQNFNTLAAHDVVNHIYNFVDRNTGVAANHVKVMWQWSKAKSKLMFDLANHDIVPDYLLESFQFKDHSYSHYWTEVPQLYPHK